MIKSDKKIDLSLLKTFKIFSICSTFSEYILTWVLIILINNKMHEQVAQNEVNHCGERMKNHINAISKLLSGTKKKNKNNKQT